MPWYWYRCNNLKGHIFHTSHTLLRVFLVSQRMRRCMKDLVLLHDVEHLRPLMTSHSDVMRTGSCDLCSVLQNHYLEVGIIRRVVTTLVQLLWWLRTHPLGTQRDDDDSAFAVSCTRFGARNPVSSSSVSLHQLTWQNSDLALANQQCIYDKKNIREDFVNYCYCLVGDPLCFRLLPKKINFKECHPRCACETYICWK